MTTKMSSPAKPEASAASPPPPDAARSATGRPGSDLRPGPLPGPVAGPGSEHRWRPIAGRAGALVLGAVLLLAAWSKALDPRAFAEQITAEGLDGLLSAGAVALLAIALEAGLGTALVLGLRRNRVLLPTAALVVFFLVLTGRAWWRASHGTLAAGAGCGCFGNLVDRTPAEAFWQDLLLLGLPLLAAFVGRRRDRTTRRWKGAAAVAVACGAVLFAWKAPVLPLDDLATRLRPGRAVSALCAGTGAGRVCLDALVPDLEEGRHLVVIADLGDAELRARVPELNEFVGAAAGDPRLWLLTDSTAEELWSFEWELGPNFEVREAPAALLDPLYRTLPRSFRVEEGRVTATWSGLPPLAMPERAPEAVARINRRGSIP